MQSISSLIKKGLGALPFCFFPLQASIYVDFDEAGRQSSEVTETNYNGWAISETSSADTTIDGVTFTVSLYNSTGTSIKCDWYKTAVQSPYYARLVGDGLTVVDGNSGGSIQMTIAGLSAGTHTLLTYHNTTNGYDHAEVNVTVNGTKLISNLTQTNRALYTDSAAFSYVTFTVTSGQTVTVLYTPNTSSSSSYQNVMINGFALDVPNSAYQAKSPYPDDLDYHADADDGSLTLSWTAASNAKSHNIYFGTDSSTVLNATTSSSVYQGNQSGTSYSTSKLTDINTYYWRVDEVDSSGTLTTGDVWSFQPRHLAFPGAEGYGRFARGGRGGRVVHVTSLSDDSTEGTLRWAVGDSTLGPRTIVFDIGGTITLGSRLTLSDDQVTVAGQTAPGMGIQIISAPFGLSGATDVIMRFMKVRVGYGTTYDGMGMAGSDYSILDHNTVNWTIDEAFSSRSGKHITLQRTMLAEALNVADHQNYASGTAHGYAASIGGDTASFHHNLLAHNEGRNWSMACGLDGDGYFWGALDIFNNVVYNWGGRTTDGGCHMVNFVNNYYKTGAASSIYVALTAEYDSFPGTQQYYCHGNIVSGHYNDTSATRNGCINDGNPDPWVDEAFFPSYATVESAYEAYKNVLSDVGVTQPALDTHDVRVIKETIDSTYWGNGSVSGDPGLPDRETDVGGFMTFTTTSRSSSFDSDDDGLPDWFEDYIGTSTASSTDDFSDANADPDGDGYTNLEDYLNYMASPHAETAKGTGTTFNLASLFRGFQKTTPSYTATDTSSCLTTSISDSTLTVTPKSACGLVYLPIKVKDSKNDTMLREVAIFVTGSTLGTAGPSLTYVGPGAVSQIVLLGDAIDTIAYVYAHCTSAQASGLPSGVSATLNTTDSTITLTGTPEATGVYAITLYTVGGDGDADSVTDSLTIVDKASEATTPASILSLVNAAYPYEGEGAYEEKNTGWIDSGYYNFTNSSTSYALWYLKATDAMDSATMLIRFANGGTTERYMGLVFNGTVIGAASFAATGAWTTYDSVGFYVNLQEGVNSLKLTSMDTNGGPNVDEFEFDVAGVTLCSTSECETTTSTPTPSTSIESPSYDPQQGLLITPTGGHAQISVFDLQGKRVASVEQTVTAGQNSLPLDKERLTKGIYWIQVQLNGTLISCTPLANLN